jgi:hypothetical protein
MFPGFLNVLYVLCFNFIDFLFLSVWKSVCLDLIGGGEVSEWATDLTLTLL